MQEMLDLSKQPMTQQPTEVQAVFYRKVDETYEILMAGPSHFSPELRDEEAIRQQLVYAKPFTLCTGNSTTYYLYYWRSPLHFFTSSFHSALADAESIRDRIAVVQRGECTFVDKARRAQAAGAWAVIVVDNAAGSSSKDQPIFAMSGDGKDDVTIPVVFLYKVEADVLAEAYRRNPTVEVCMDLRAQV